VTRQVALLRGVNVGGRNTLPMAPLREAVTAAGYTDVRTHLQSGNVVFTTKVAPARSAKEVSSLIAEKFGLTIPVVVRTAEELAAVVSGNPLPEAVAEPARFLITFLSAAPAPEVVAAIDPAKYAPDVVRVRGREVYLYLPGGIRDSKLAALRWDRSGLVATGRNWNTVLRLLEMAAG